MTRSRIQILGFAALILTVVVGWAHALISPSSHVTWDQKGEEDTVEVSLLDKLPTATVFLNEDGKEHLCGSWTGSRFPCGGQKWQYVGYTMGESGGEWAPCIWAHPHDNKTLRIRFPKIKLGTSIGGKAAFIGNVPETGAAVSLHFRADGKPIGKMSIDSKKRGWKTIDIPLKNVPEHEVTLEVDIQTPKAFRRLFCMDPTLIYSQTSGGK
jgi:hypothetical protein